MAINDPYPETLDDVPFQPPGTLLEVQTDAALVAAITRLAQAVEQNTLALLHPVKYAGAIGGNAPQPVQNAPLAPLPPVTVVAAKPPCPFHGVDKVAPSSKGGFYCQSKAGPGQPANPKGYCTWHT